MSLSSDLDKLLRELRKKQGGLKSTGAVPYKKKSKPVGYKMQNTFEKNLRGVPGGSRSRTGSMIRMIDAPNTGTKLGPEIGMLRSAHNANTTQGSYVRTRVVDERTDAQGRVEFGR